MHVRIVPGSSNPGSFFILFLNVEHSSYRGVQQFFFFFFYFMFSNLRLRVHVNRVSQANSFKNEKQTSPVLLSWFTGTPSTAIQQNRSDKMDFWPDS